MPVPVPVRVLIPVGTRIDLRSFWGDKDCPNCAGSGHPGYHNAHSEPIEQTDRPRDVEARQHYEADHFPPWCYPTRCDHCGAEAPTDPQLVRHQVFSRVVYRAPDGSEVIGESRQIGDMWPVPCWRGDLCEWENCSGTHWVVRCPGGATWDTDSRASNCTLKDERTHRCWVLQRRPDGAPHTSSKGGHTCQAGAGSIQTGNWHGFLRGGMLTE